MNELMEKAHGNTGAEYITSAFRKYRIFTMIYATMDFLYFISTIYQNSNPVRLIRLILGFILTLGIIYSIYPKSKIEYIKYMLIAGFVGQLINTAYVGFYVRIISLKSFNEFSPNQKLITYLGVIQTIIGLSIIVLFLLILIFNINSAKIGAALCCLVISSFILVVISYIGVFTDTKLNTFIPADYLPQGYRLNYFINLIKTFVISINELVFHVLVFLISWRIMKSK